ncbi:hypothetical protein [Synechocystis sp. CACIAM 05]|uniref:hypothetical protein n=1 Tax=Synechocystis sp. CACIAM 05 TaxID=1933929 RepID=UPI00138E8A3B|nr:hypothetical protein [Synechocystis sp. CACIAM 05]QHU98974.1 hypothetical protein BWK47_01705 [Synechocystis sp. CACIAM 05]
MDNIDKQLQAQLKSLGVEGVDLEELKQKMLATHISDLIKVLACAGLIDPEDLEEDYTIGFEGGCVAGNHYRWVIELNPLPPVDPNLN